VHASAAPAVAGKNSAIINPSEPVANHREALGRFKKRKALALAAVDLVEIRAHVLLDATHRLERQ
jgi:hypothetical protein